MHVYVYSIKASTCVDLNKSAAQLSNYFDPRTQSGGHIFSILFIYFINEFNFIYVFFVCVF